jgi:hypothetical protein
MTVMAKNFISWVFVVTLPAAHATPCEVIELRVLERDKPSTAIALLSLSKPYRFPVGLVILWR